MRHGERLRNGEALHASPLPRRPEPRTGCDITRCPRSAEPVHHPTPDNHLSSVAFTHEPSAVLGRDGIPVTLAASQRTSVSTSSPRPGCEIVNCASVNRASWSPSQGDAVEDWRRAATAAWCRVNLAMSRALYASAEPLGSAAAGVALAPAGVVLELRGGGLMDAARIAWVAAPLGSREERGDDYVKRGDRYRPAQLAALGSQMGSYLAEVAGIPRRALWVPPPADRGVVIVGGGRVMAQAMLALWSLRQTGCELPASVWVYADERPGPYAEAFLRRSLNATLAVVEDVLPPLSGTDAGGPALLSRRVHDQRSFFTLKVAAVAFAPYREVLLLDADNVALRDPTAMFDDPGYRRTGALTWPDFWGLSFDPQLLEALAQARAHAERHGWKPAGSPQPGNPRMSSPARGEVDSVGAIDYEALLARAGFPAPRQTHESGQMVIDRSQHLVGLWLALLFMAYPNRTLEHLLSNTAGMGDKEAFAWGVTAAGGDYAMTPHAVRAAGTTFEGEGFRGNAMAQSAPEDGLLLFLHANLREWDCAGVPRTLGERDHRFTQVTGLGELREYLRSDAWVATGAPRWGAGDLEATLWAVTRGMCAALRDGGR